MMVCNDRDEGRVWKKKRKGPAKDKHPSGFEQVR